MELKYYLRGLGLGIAITAIVMGIVSSKNKAMSNEEIIARAKQLGMTENTVLDEINNKDDGQDEDKPGEADNVANPSASGENETSTAKAQASEANETSDVLGENPRTGTRKTDSGVDAEAGEESKTASPEVKPEESSPAPEASPDSSVSDGQNNNSETQPSETQPPETQPSETDTAASDKPMEITVGRGDGSYSVSKKLEDVGAIESAGEFDNFLCNNGYDKKIRTGTYTIPANASEEQMARIITGIE